MDIIRKQAENISANGVLTPEEALTGLRLNEP
jgi:hypothetical protein